MAITTYAELQAAAANWLVRGDLAARIPEFITLAEVRLNRVLRTRLAEVEQPLTAVPGSRTIPLPAAFAEPLVLWLVKPQGLLALPFLEASRLAACSLRGEPGAWTVDGAHLALDRPADQPYALTLRMLRKFALSDAQPSNTLLADQPDIYLFAVLCEAAPFLRDTELSNAYEARLARAIEEANAKEARSRAASTLTTELPALARERG